MSRGRVLILWNQLDDDVVEMWRRDGRRAPDWDPNLLVEPWDTVAEEIDQILDCVKQAGYDATAINIRDNFDTLLDVIRTERPDVVMSGLFNFQTYHLLSCRLFPPRWPTGLPLLKPCIRR